MRPPFSLFRTRGERGAAAVEMALLLPFLLLLVFGIIDFGRALNSQISLTQAAREGARLAALKRPPGEVTTRVQEAAFPLDGVGVAATTCPLIPAPADRATVTANFTFEFLTPIGPLAELFTGDAGEMGGDIAMTGRGVMRCSG